MKQRSILWQAAGLALVTFGRYDPPTRILRQNMAKQLDSSCFLWYDVYT